MGRSTPDRAEGEPYEPQCSVRSVPALGLVVLVLVVASFATVARGQAAAERPLVSLGADFGANHDGIRLVDGWRFSPGDDPRWADPSFDDSGWLPVPDTVLNFEPIQLANVKRDVEFETRGGELLEGWDGKGWFRFRFDAHPALANTVLLLDVSQAGASEVYLDGALVARYGRVASGDATELSYDPAGLPTPLRLGRNAAHVLAVRYSCLAVPRLESGLIDLPEIQARGAGFVAHLRPPGVTTAVTDERALAATVGIGAMGALAGIALAHLFASFWLPEQRHHRLLAWFCVSGCALLLVRAAIDAGRVGAGLHAYLSLTHYLLILVCGLAFAAFMHEAFTPEQARFHLFSAGFAAIVTGIVAVLPQAVTPYLYGIAAAYGAVYVRMAIVLVRGREWEAPHWWILACAFVIWCMVPLRSAIHQLLDLPPRVEEALVPVTLTLVAAMCSLVLVRGLVIRRIDADVEMREIQAVTEGG
jgi:hypothetical protein